VKLGESIALYLAQDEVQQLITASIRVTPDEVCALVSAGKDKQVVFHEHAEAGGSVENVHHALDTLCNLAILHARTLTELAAKLTELSAMMRARGWVVGDLYAHHYQALESGAAFVAIENIPIVASSDEDKHTH
jgi:hypothetical protein